MTNPYHDNRAREKRLTMQLRFRSRETFMEAYVRGVRAVLDGKRTQEQLRSWIGLIKLGDDYLNEEEQDLLNSLARVSAKICPAINRGESDGKT